MSELPTEAERLLAVAPDDFVAERGRVARELREAGRREEATAVAAMRKPSAVVLAVNRAARDRPQVARDAAAAAERVLETQFSGAPQAFTEATKDLERSLDLLADVALAHVAPRGRSASDAMSRRVRDLLRAAVADEGGRSALARGLLGEEREAAGFAALAGSVAARAAPRPPTGRRRAAGSGASSERARETKRSRERRAREERLRAELARAEGALAKAERALGLATEERDRAASTVAAIRRKLERP